MSNDLSSSRRFEEEGKVVEIAEEKSSGDPSDFGAKDLFKALGDLSENDTLSRDNPISEFIRNQKVNLKGMTQEEFMEKYEAHLKEIAERKEESKSARPASSKHSRVESGDLPLASPHSFHGSQLTSIVLKFTTLSEASTEAPSFCVGVEGAKIGRDPTNEVNVPSDAKLAPVAHSIIEYYKGNFYITDCGYDYAASVRIGVGCRQKKWAMEADARFSAGNSVFRSCGVNEDGNLVLDVIEGPLKGEKKIVDKKAGATLGRSSDNAISVPDRELSRRHSRLEFDEDLSRYVLIDLGSTNGTYMQLVGPYGGKHKLNLNDHILVGRTGFSVNRFDFGLSEEIGHRQTMEDACTIVQHLNIAPLNIRDLSPQSFFGVFDGHGGSQASLYVSQNLHVNVAEGLMTAAPELLEVLDKTYENGGGGSSGGGVDGDHATLAKEAIDKIVVKLLKETFLKTDSDFIRNSTHPLHGSTATTALILGQRLYCANVGDSRTLLCRNFQAIAMSQDHKPNREDEAQRIRDAGGFVINNRVMGELAVSRAFGDSEFKKGIPGIQSQLDGDNKESSSSDEKAAADDSSDSHPNWAPQSLIIAEPDIQVTTITENDQFLLVGCDGLFDVFTGDDVVRFVKANLEEHGDAQKCCQNLTHEAIRKRHSRDNVSVILIILHKWY